MPITRRAWFNLARHDDSEPTPEGGPESDTPAVEPEGSPESDPEGAEQLGDAGKKALERMKAERADARRRAAEEKKRADELARKVEEFEERDKTELEKAQGAAERAASRAAKATQRAVTAEVKAAAGDFADPDDALAFLTPRLAEYADADGEINTDAIASDLAGLLERKPHLRKPASEPDRKPGPKPDPSQGPRPTPAPTDYRTADKGALTAHLAEVAPGFRLRT